MLSDKNQQILLERDTGATLQTIGDQFGVTQQRVSAIVTQGTEFVNKVELDLMVARRTDEQCAYIVPYSADYELAMAFSTWLIERLRSRGMNIGVTTRRASNGLALRLTDHTDYAPEAT